jgi:hypothetical protein
MKEDLIYFLRSQGGHRTQCTEGAGHYFLIRQCKIIMNSYSLYRRVQLCTIKNEVMSL